MSLTTSPTYASSKPPPQQKGSAGILYGIPVHVSKEVISDESATSKPKRHYKKRIANPDKEEFKERILKKAKAGTAVTRHCKNCGKPGHRSDGCPVAKSGLKPRDWDGDDEEAEI
jgi:hypothetical protein